MGEMTVILLPSNTRKTTLIPFSRTGEGGDSGDEEMDDWVEEGEEDGEIEDEDGDHVTETEEAQSEEGKQPVFHHEIYDRLVNLMGRQGAYSIPLPTPLLQRTR